jgi:hypothetical protein
VAKVKVTNSSDSQNKSLRPALTPEARENQMIALAKDLVEQRLLNGTASSQETTHFLKLGSMKAQLEKVRLERENKLLAAKTDALENQKEIKELYENALKAMKNYGGYGEQDDY